MDENDGDERWDKWPEEQRTQAAASRWLKEQSVFKRKELDREDQIPFLRPMDRLHPMEGTQAHCDTRGVALMGDVPYGVSYYSSDVFSQPEIFDLSWSGGAPPEKVFKSDPFTEKWGQNWGIPLYRWDLIREGASPGGGSGCRWCARFFTFSASTMSSDFTAFTVSRGGRRKMPNILPLSGDEARERTGGRLPGFLPREDSSWENREANRREGEEYLRVLLETVGANRLIGEDLGVVPITCAPALLPSVSPGSKSQIGKRSTMGGMVDGRNYQRLSVATYATHDHPPLRSLWEELNTAAKAGDGQHSMRCDAWPILRAFPGKCRGPIPTRFIPRSSRRSSEEFVDRYLHDH